MSSSEQDWQVGLKSIGTRAAKILNSGDWSDCTFAVGSDSNLQKIQAHRLILAMSSPVFEAMFFGGMAEKEGKVIEVLDVQPQAFNALLKYLYTDEIKLSSFEQVCEVCYVAKKYMIPPLVELCTSFIWKDLHPGNVCRAYEFAKLFEEPQLIEKCLHMMKTQTAKLLTDPSFDEIDVSTIKTILSQDVLQADELTLWVACERWAKKECCRREIEDSAANQRIAMQDLLPLFRFLTMSPTLFANGPALSDILTKEEAFMLLMNISAPGAAAMPPNFSINTMKRQASPRVASSTDPIQPREAGNLVPFNCDCAGPVSSAFINEQLVDCTLTFSVSRNVIVTGVIIPTQVRPHGFMPEVLQVQQQHGYQNPFRYPHDHTLTRQHLTKYPELIYAFIQDSVGSRLTYTHFSGSVPWDHCMDVFFNTPIVVVPNKTYKIVVVLNKMGRYPIFETLPIVPVEDMQFSFQADNGESLIKTIIFIKDSPR